MTFIVFYVACVAVTWWFYFRRNAEIPCRSESQVSGVAFSRLSILRRAAATSYRRNNFLAYTTVLLQTITALEGEGLDSPTDLGPSYTLSQGCTAGVQYARAGNTAEGWRASRCSKTVR